MSRHAPTRIDGCRAIRDTGKALLVEHEGDAQWIPQSQILDDSEVFDAEDNAEGVLCIPFWLAEEKGWV